MALPCAQYRTEPHVDALTPDALPMRCIAFRCLAVYCSNACILSLRLQKWYKVMFFHIGCGELRCNTVRRRTTPQCNAYGNARPVWMRRRATPFGAVPRDANIDPTGIRIFARPCGLRSFDLCVFICWRALIRIWVQSMAPATFEWLATAWKACSLASGVGWSAGKEVNLGSSFTDAFVQSVTEVIDRRPVPTRGRTASRWVSEGNVQTYSAKIYTLVSLIKPRPWPRLSKIGIGHKVIGLFRLLDEAIGLQWQHLTSVTITIIIPLTGRVHGHHALPSRYNGMISAS